MKTLLKNGILVGLFGATIFSSIAFGLIGKIPETEIKGVTVEVEKPRFSLENYINGTYQSKYEEWYSNHFPERSYFLKGYSQLIYSLFNESPNDEVVVGNDGQLLEKAYIEAYLDLRESTDKNYFDTLIEDLKYIQEACKTAGKYFAVVVTPSKAAYYPEYIPAKYYRMAESINSDYNYFISKLQERNIDYFDTYSYLKEIQDSITIPIFPKTGTHWNTVVGGKVANGFVDFINTKANFNIPNIVTGEIESSETPFDDVDQDIYSIMNVTYADVDPLYYRADTYLSEPVIDKKSLFWEGGSFSWQILNCFEENSLFRNMDFIFYQQMIRQYRNQLHIDVNLHEENMEQYLEDALTGKDIIILEVNQENVNMMGYGFPQRLKQYIEKNGFPKIEFPTSYNVNDSVEISEHILEGFYGVEEMETSKQRWMTKEGLITLAADEIQEKGLELVLDVPLNYLNQSTEQAKALEIIVNNELVGHFVLMKNGQITISIPQEVLGEPVDGQYKIKLAMSHTFKVQDYEGGMDDRDISIGLISVGPITDREKEPVPRFKAHDEEVPTISHVVGIYGEDFDGTDYYHWMGKNAVMTLENQDITQNGLEIRGKVFLNYLNARTSEPKVLTIYINQQKVSTTQFDESGSFVIEISKEAIPASENHKYTVYLEMSSTFNTFKDIGIEQDRELSIQLQYVGAPLNDKK